MATIQTPEFLKEKERRAQEGVGKHLLVGLACKDGFVFGKPRSGRFGGRDKRGNKTPPWFSFFNERIFVVTIGDLGDMQQLHPAVENDQESISEWISPRYVTERFTAKSVRSLMRYEYNSGGPTLFSLHTVVGSVRSSNSLHLIGSDGKWRQFPNFVVAGCSVDSETCRNAKRGAIDFLKKKWKNYKANNYLVRGKAAGRMLIEVFEKFDPPGDSNILDMIFITNRVSKDKGGFYVVEAELERKGGK